MLEAPYVASKGRQCRLASQEKFVNCKQDNPLPPTFNR
jgi:hypothetical protein